ASFGGFTQEPPLSNYHSFAQRVVREWGWLLGISPALRIADAAERWMHVEAVLAELRPVTLWNPLRPHDLMDPLLDVIGYAKQELVTPEGYQAWARRRLDDCADPAQRALLQRHAEIAEVYARLDERYRRHAVFDHDDCILYAQRLLDEHEAVRSAVAGGIRYVMVDEYQDTNFAQARLVETLVADHGNILVVADDDQAIYKFRGASRANLDRFRRTYRELHEVVLSSNYRSTAPIVAAAASIIAGAPPATRIDKRLVSERGEGAAVEVWRAGAEHAEAAAVAAECAALIRDGTRPADIAWLFRQHVDMTPAIQALREAGVPYQVYGGRGFFQQKEIKDILALLTAADDPEDVQALMRCLHLPAWQVSNAGRMALASAARDHDVPLVTLIAERAVSGLDEADAGAAQRCVHDLLELHGMCRRDDVRDVFFACLERSRFLDLLDVPGEPARMQMGANLNKLGELLEGFADWSDDRHVSAALRYLSVLRNSRSADELASIEPIEDGVVLLTVHSAKGLEWPVVFLARCVESRWSSRPTSPHRIDLPDELVPEPAPAGEGVIDEERRLFYVACTRARDRLVFTWAKRYTGMYNDQDRSQFLTEVARGVETQVRERTGTVSLQPQRARGGPLAERLTVSVSDLRAYKACPRRFEYRKRYQLPVRDTVQSWYGTLVHGVLQAAAAQRGSGALVDGDAVATLWQQAWEQSRGPKGLHAELRGLGEEQLRRYIASPAWQDARILRAEDRFVMQLPGGDVVGRFDRVDADGGVATVIDYKTGRPKPEESARRDLQVRAYAVAAAEREQAERAAVELHFLQTAEVTRVVFDNRALDKAKYQVAATTAEITASWRDGYFPPRPSQWQCSRCEYRTVCDEGLATVQH
ncbi:MAG TPA: ATP-dependent DNA helicase, partial [Candidatus Dormibacteraeota bacterium]|nr:ATP-dependent DNA helicase [Candidatus Dormibacteraeota bacterium]